MITDTTTKVEDLKKIVKKFRDERGWFKYHNPKDLAISIAVEASELLELFQWREKISSKEARKYKKLISGIKDELADVLIYSLSLSDVLKLDLSQIIFNKIKKNEKRFPAKKWKEKSQEYLRYK